MDAEQAEAHARRNLEILMEQIGPLAPRDFTYIDAYRDAVRAAALAEYGGDPVAMRDASYQDGWQAALAESRAGVDTANMAARAAMDVAAESRALFAAGARAIRLAAYYRRHGIGDAGGRDEIDEWLALLNAAALASPVSTPQEEHDA